MKMITFSKFGSTEVLQFSEKNIQNLRNNEVMIKVVAAGLNPIDYKIREGTSFVSQKLKDHLPSCLGYELSGKIVAVGQSVTRFSIGDSVLGFAGFPDEPKCYAQYVITTAEQLIHKPTNLNFISAGCMPMASLTALQALELAPFSGNWRDKIVLIHAGAGGVGHFAVQLAHLWGASVITTASLHNHDFLYELGATHCIDYKNENFLDIVQHVDMVLDLMGGEVGLKSLALLDSSGCLVTVPTITADKIIAEGRNLNVMGMIMKPDMKQLADLAELVAIGKLKVAIGKVFRLEDVQEAHKALQAGHTAGKLVFSMK